MTTEIAVQCSPITSSCEGASPARPAVEGTLLAALAVAGAVSIHAHDCRSASSSAAEARIDAMLAAIRCNNKGKTGR